MPVKSAEKSATGLAAEIAIGLQAPLPGASNPAKRACSVVGRLDPSEGDDRAAGGETMSTFELSEGRHTGPQSALPTELLRQIELLADDALSPEEEADLLRQLDQVPAGWRACALALLEVRALRRALKAFGPAGSANPRGDWTIDSRLGQSGELYGRGNLPGPGTAAPHGPTLAAGASIGQRSAAEPRARWTVTSPPATTARWIDRPRYLRHLTYAVSVVCALFAAFIGGRMSALRQDISRVVAVSGDTSEGGTQVQIPSGESPPAAVGKLPAASEGESDPPVTSLAVGATSPIDEDITRHSQADQSDTQPRWPVGGWGVASIVPVVIQGWGGEHAVAIPVVETPEIPWGAAGKLVGSEAGSGVESRPESWPAVEEVLHGPGYLTVKRRLVEWLTVDGRRVIVPVEEVALIPAHTAKYQ